MEPANTCCSLTADLGLSVRCKNKKKTRFFTDSRPRIKFFKQTKKNFQNRTRNGRDISISVKKWNTCMHARMHVHMHAPHAHACTHTHLSTYTHAHAYTHPQYTHNQHTHPISLRGSSYIFPTVTSQRRRTTRTR